MVQGLEAGSEQQPTPAWEDRVLEPALSQKLNQMDEWPGRGRLAELVPDLHPGTDRTS